MLTALVVIGVGSISVIGLAIVAAVLPLLFTERGAQMTFVIHSSLLLISGVYAPVDVLPGWLQVLSPLSPMTYVLRWRARRPARWRAAVSAVVGDLLILARDGRGAGAWRAAGLPGGGALRTADRPPEAEWLAS